MKKVLFILCAIVFASFSLTGCGNGSIESDAKKVAELQCKALKLVQKASSGDFSVIEESAKLTSEASALASEMEGKYNSDSDKQKFGEALLKEMGKCN